MIVRVTAEWLKVVGVVVPLAAVATALLGGCSPSRPLLEIPTTGLTLVRGTRRLILLSSLPLTPPMSMARPASTAGLPGIPLAPTGTLALHPTWERRRWTVDPRRAFGVLTVEVPWTATVV